MRVSFGASSFLGLAYFVLRTLHAQYERRKSAVTKLAQATVRAVPALGGHPAVSARLFDVAVADAAGEFHVARLNQLDHARGLGRLGGDLAGLART